MKAVQWQITNTQCESPNQVFVQRARAKNSAQFDCDAIGTLFVVEVDVLGACVFALEPLKNLLHPEQFLIERRSTQAHVSKIFADVQRISVVGFEVDLAERILLPQTAVSIGVHE